MERYTIIVVPDRNSRVRRFQVRRALVRRAVVIAGVVALVLVVGLFDYVRLRINAVDVGRLRAETTAQRVQLKRLTESLANSEDRLTQLREFEHKVRIIANLPSTVAEHLGNEPDATDGVGGGEDDAPATAQQNGAPAAKTSQKAAPVGAGTPHAALDPAVLERLIVRAQALGQAAVMEQASYEELVKGLQSRRQLLASTPSIWPVHGWVTSGFGERTSPFTGLPEFHAGLDIAAPYGTAVDAPARGRVVFVGMHGPLGRAVELDHGHGLKTYYGHLSKTTVHVGELVQRGQKIGEIGLTGRTTGPHLHYAVEIDGKAVNPRTYILN